MKFPENERRGSLLLLCAATLYQFVKYRLCFAKGEPLLLSTSPIITFDYCFNEYYARLSRALFWDGGHFWGYDPTYMAGYPHNQVCANSLPIEVLSALLPFIPTGLVVRIGIFAAVMTFPWLLYRACRNFGLTLQGATIALILGVMYFWEDVVMVMVMGGMISGLLVSTLSPYVFSLYLRCIREGTSRDWVKILFWSPLMLLIHKTAAVILAPCFLAGLAANRSRIKGALLLRFVGVALFTLAVNFFWIRPMLHFIGYKVPMPHVHFWESYRWMLRMYHFPGGHAIITNAALVLIFLFLGLGALARVRRTAQPGIWIALFAAAAFFFTYVYSGQHWGALSVFQPYRYAVPAFFLLSILIGLGYQGELREKGPARFLRAHIPAALVIAAFFALAPQWSFYSVRGLVRLSSELPGDLPRLRQYIEEETDRSARILIEESGMWDRDLKGGKYYSTYFPGLIPLYADREIVGGPFPYAYLTHHHTSFVDGVLLGREIGDFTIEALRERIEGYNIRWIVCWSPQAVAAFTKDAGHFYLDKVIGNFHIYVHIGKTDYFFKGSGRIEAALNEIRIEDAEAEDGEIVIKYHWMEGLESLGGGRIERHSALDDPIPFIRIVDPPECVRIVNGYGL